jgi:hypothetical protein
MGGQAMEEESKKAVIKPAVARWSENSEMSDASMIADQMQSASLNDTTAPAAPAMQEYVSEAWPTGLSKMQPSSCPVHRRIAQLRGEGGRPSVRHLQHEVQEAHKVKRRRTNSMDLSGGGIGGGDREAVS